MQITDSIFDPELGCTAFTLERITYTRSRVGTTSRSMKAQALGCIHPGTPEMIQFLPEEEKTDEFIAIYTDHALSTGTPEGSGASEQGDGSFRNPKGNEMGCPRRSPTKGNEMGCPRRSQAYAVLMRE